MLESVAAHLPDRYLSDVEIEEAISKASCGFKPPSGILRQLTGVRGVHVSPDGQQASDLAVMAARKTLDECGVRPGDVDLLIFAASSQDMVEPATGHIVAAKLGLECPAFDVKNACNSVLNAMEITQALIATGGYRRVLVACGEAPSRCVRWSVSDAAAFARSFASYGFSDAGAALLWRASSVGEPPGRGFLGTEFAAVSSAWSAAVVEGGGTVHPDGGEHRFFRMDGVRMRQALRRLDAHPWRLLDQLGLRWDDFAVVGIHQVSVSDIDEVCSRRGIPRDRVIDTVSVEGNVASASLPLQLARAMERGRAAPGDLVALVGLAAGASAGMAVIRL
ncbi:3-oxoacyl-ACP synthase III family protein [Streptantibioticus parmotrematis]|uniref:3-oxoacyl-ACP synthase III family protein n=1 Tax=Streptantibioticus parmotrematis TaxID=2873249 RepID=UPI0027E0C642|nr:3-oxoacyl-[acyl-carrier-protein] synthase III C-terminal domain-containing protein [Streptantibioticus parmotrematis]